MEIHSGVGPEKRFSFSSERSTPAWDEEVGFESRGNGLIAHSVAGGQYIGPLRYGVGRPVTIPSAPGGGRYTCEFIAWVRSSTYLPYEDDVHFDIEVTDPDTWHYITVKKIKASHDAGWSTVSTNPFTARPKVFLRASILAKTNDMVACQSDVVDDFTLLCNRTPSHRGG